MNHRLQSLIVAAITVASLTPRVASALVVTTCGTTCSTNCELGNNLNCSSGQNGVTIAAGVQLDLKGHYISCTAGAGDSCNDGVVMTGPGATVLTSVAPTFGSASVGILGNWVHGVNCAGKPNSHVTGITIRGFFGTSAVTAPIYQCQTVDNNTISGLPDPSSIGWDGTAGVFVTWSRVCIRHTSISSVDLISDNHIDGCESAVLSTGSLAVTIDSNNVNCRDHTAPATGGGNCIDLGTTVRGTTTSNNVIEGDSRFSVIQAPSSGGFFQNNVCKLGLFGCSTCVSLGRCVANGTTTSP